MFEGIITKLDRTEDANKACNWNSLNFGNINISHNEGDRRTSTCRAEHTWSSLPIQRNASDIPQCHCTQGRNIACSPFHRESTIVLRYWWQTWKTTIHQGLGVKRVLLTIWCLKIGNDEWQMDPLMIWCKTNIVNSANSIFFPNNFPIATYIHDNAGGSPRLSTGFCSPACLLSIPRPRWGASPLQMSLNLI